MWVSMSLVAFMICVGIGVDFAGQATAEQHARAVAAEAARAGGQFLQVQPGLRPRPDVYAATQAAQAYVAGSDFTGDATVQAGTIRVSVTGTYQCQFLGIIGINTLPLHGDGAATVIPVIAGEEA
ncbi:pilus assembly protein [Tessaracoccus antarcticus]|uniref:Pilus assembly protein n=1 Tax=Tessaracoccus antarcticus TaxID=2479848 RepID=A0A3M0FYS2_9ACTN|nr:pilus assembly protein [Tessaracoccus antarcticus]